MINKLIELLKSAKYPVFEGYPAEISLGVQHSDVAFEAICNHLISHNTIVLPCRVGDVVYIPWKWEDSDGIAEVEVQEIKIYDDKNNIKFYIDMQSDDEDFNQSYGGWKDGRSIGETVFLSKKEAKQLQLCQKENKK